MQDLPEIATHSYRMIHLHCGDHTKALYEPSYLKPKKDVKNLYEIVCAFINTLNQNAALDIFNHPNTHILRFKIKNSATRAMFIGQFNPKKGTKETLDALEQYNSNALHTKPQHFWSGRFKRISKSDFLYTQPFTQRSMSRNDIILALNIKTPKSDRALLADRIAEEAGKSRIISQANKRAQSRIANAQKVNKLRLTPIEESPRVLLQETTLNTGRFLKDIDNMKIRRHTLNMQRDKIKEKAEEKKEARDALNLPVHVLHETFQPAGGSLKKHIFTLVQKKAKSTKKSG